MERGIRCHYEKNNKKEKLSRRIDTQERRENMTASEGGREVVCNDNMEQFGVRGLDTTIRRTLKETKEHLRTVNVRQREKETEF